MSPCGAGFTYEVRGSVSAATVEELQASGSGYPFWTLQRYLQLPSDLGDESLERLRRLAAAIVVDAASPYDMAAAIEGYLCCTPLRDSAGVLLLDAEGQPRVVYPFTTDIELPPPRADAVTWWLLDNRDEAGLPIGGYYDYHASAMAVLLRTLGIPARISTGYVLTEDNFDARTRTFIVRGQHAYSWVEVFFPEYGWVDFDPTPPVVSEGFIGIAGERIAAQRLRPFASGRGRPVGPRLDSLELFDELLLLEELSQTDFSRESASTFNLWWVLAPLIGIAALVTVSGTGVAAWRLSLRGQTPVERLWTSTQRLSRWGGLPVDPADTPREHADVLGAVVRDPEASRQLADTYTRERFGRGELVGTGSEPGPWRLAGPARPPAAPGSAVARPAGAQRSGRGREPGRRLEHHARRPQVVFATPFQRHQGLLLPFLRDEHAGGQRGGPHERHLVAPRRAGPGSQRRAGTAARSRR